MAPARTKLLTASSGRNRQASKDAVRPNDTAAEQRLVMCCLAGQERAWEQLYRRCHTDLVDAITLLLGPKAKDSHLVEEIAARVWYAVLRNEARLLARYDPDRNSSLSAFFMGLARVEILRHRREEGRRKRHEMTGGRKPQEEPDPSEWSVRSIISEFARTLTPLEKEFMDEYLTSSEPNDDAEGDGTLPATTIWQRRHRIRTKLQAFLEEFR